ncbi:hypothetical protein PAXRUDRAFT_171714 [Paxillus rubicundulus Ve08.2h10]|uniref:F-box domain-containing protein n=1 Tax=Paxillus rubicundulus Ve08.2h10 TaxID=930991 RepID=A0A0D0BWY1_9AGAM|nr:hypothetical protein PAXRUDRAFT_171714 [Paxillus rubicundulus Ve08.2h10]
MPILDDGFKFKQLPDPLTALPSELVGEIFHLWLVGRLYPHPQYSYSQLPVLLCLVSKSWRDFVYASPLLWAHVIIEVSQGAVANLNVLQQRLERSQSVPLFLEIVVGDDPDKDTLGVLFAESSRFCQLTLGVLNMSWLDDIPADGFTQLKKLTVRTWTRPGMVLHEDELNAIFANAPRLRCVNWHSTADPGPVRVNGHQLRFLDLIAFRVPITRVLEVLAACPNLRNAAINFMDEHDHIPMPLRERMLLPELRSLYLYGSRHLTCLLESVQAPFLSSLEIHWVRYNGRACGLQALQSLLAYSPHVEDIALHEFLHTEDGLISILTNNKNLVRLTASAESDRKRLVTKRTFDLLTRQEDGNYMLPRLEELVFRGGLCVPDETVLRMIRSRTSLPCDLPYSSGSRRGRTLKSICLDRCRPMTFEKISELDAICRESGLKVAGTFASRNHDRIFYLDYGR